MSFKRLSPIPTQLPATVVETWAETGNVSAAFSVDTWPATSSNIPRLCRRYVGRNCSASPATGSKTAHTKELSNLLSDAFEL